MSKQYQLEDNGTFTIDDYQNAHPFSNFLPGIAGVWGVPMWVFYVNRGQGVISFGIEDKDHSITEFYPANKSYWLASSVGFRTFFKINDKDFYEPFKASANHNKDQMRIKSGSFAITENSSENGLQTKVSYFTLPNMPVAGLIRVLTVKNTSNSKKELDILDGISRIMPYGSADFFLKNMSRTLEAWMHSEVKDNLATFRLIVDPQDVSLTRYIEGANFNYSFFEEKGKKKYPQLIVDPAVIFGHDTTYVTPSSFLASSFGKDFEQIKCGKTPCSFSYFKWILNPGEEKTFYSIFGSSMKEELIKRFVIQTNATFLKSKEDENEDIVEGIKSNAFCVSNSPEFDHYVKTTYLDNVLRGGYPYQFDGTGFYYVYSRKHGDLERDYNKFRLLPSYFSEGEANYRDINQNRRIDWFFKPKLGKRNISYFLNLTKIDGYNPLIVKGEKMVFNEAQAKTILKAHNIKDKQLFTLMTEGFHLGELFNIIEEKNIFVADKERLAQDLVEKAEFVCDAAFGEGHWIDHWRYNLDLIQTYLYFYPDKKKNLFSSKDYLYWDDDHHVKDRKYRYELSQGKVYQWQGIEPVEEKTAVINRRRTHKNYLHTSSGKIYKTHLIEKLLTLVLNKSATLDPDGIGVEMEAGKPGWCDSLNGLPALFGSSLCETLALKRTCLIALDGLETLKKDGKRAVNVTEEVALFQQRLEKLLKEYFAKKTSKRDYKWWDKANNAKEDFRKSTFFEISGKEKEISITKLESFLKQLVKKLDEGISKAKNNKAGAHNTYFTFEVTKFRQTQRSIYPLEFKRHALPLFLEGPVQILRVNGNKNEYKGVKSSDLFDKKLKMYRLNAPLHSEPLEIGRSRIFVPGWLENETIWLHMEYKYLLEVLKGGLYKEFFEDLKNCCICYFDPQTYGRNILENSSFIVSSVYPDKSLWGKGFVARLSGATVELLNMWMLMCFGHKPFSLDKDGVLSLKFAPILKGDMFTTSKKELKVKGKKVSLPANTFSFKLFSSTLVVYHNPSRKDTFSKGAKVEKITLKSGNKQFSFQSDTVSGPIASAIRNQEIARIDVYFEK